MANDTMSVDNKEDIKSSEQEIEDLEWSADQEILLLYSLHGYKPVGPNKHFRMLLIQERLSNAMNKNISSHAIWKKLNTLYDLEALDEAEAEADAAVAVDTVFSLPRGEFGELMAKKIKVPSMKLEKDDDESESDTQEGENCDIKAEPESEADITKELDTSELLYGKTSVKKENSKRGLKKKDTTAAKEVSVKKENAKDFNKKDTPTKKEVAKDVKKGALKEDERKDMGKRSNQESKKDGTKENKRETPNKINKRESFKFDSKKDNIKKTDQKKVADLKSIRGDITKSKGEISKLRNDTPKRAEIKSVKVELSKSQKSDSTPIIQRSEPIKKDLPGDKRKDIADQKTERKSPDKTPESPRGTKLRARDKKDIEVEKFETPTVIKRERSRDSTSKAEVQSDEPAAKRAKTPIKGRPTRNSLEPAQKNANPPKRQGTRSRVL